MYRGVAIWNYAGDAVENAERFHKAGFDAISWNAPLFVDRYNDDDRERVAEYLIRNETMDGETFVKVFEGETVPDKVVGEDLITELDAEKSEAADKPETATNKTE